MIRVLCFATVLILSFFGSLPLANAQQSQPTHNFFGIEHSPYNWGSAIWNGRSFFTERFASRSATTTGSVTNGVVLYNIDYNWNLGIKSELERRILTTFGREVEQTASIAILPILQFNYTAGRLSPYIHFGAGINFNTFDDDENVATLCGVLGVGACDFSPEETITARVGVGADFFVSDQLAINFEGAWARNSGDITLKIADVTGATRSYTGDSAEALIGFRYYFSPCSQC